MTYSNILLIQPMHEKQKRAVRESINFPWGIASLAAALQQAGCRVQFLDGQALQLPKEELAPLIDKYDFDIVGISAFSTQYPAVRFLTDYIKDRTDVPVVVGGPLTIYQPQLVLDTTRVDVCVTGEGEITAVELMRHYDQLHQIKGIAYRDHGQVVVNPPQDQLVDLDELPPPDFSIFDMERYLKQRMSFNRKVKGRAITLVTSRGCPYSCNFCSKSSRRYRSMSPDTIYDLARMMKQEFGIECLNFGDELFLANKKRFAELAPRLKSLALPWGSQARVNIMDREFLTMIKHAGCVGVGYGIESGSAKILANMNKRITPEQIETAMRETMRQRINVKVQLIFGYPGEDDDTVAETIDLFRRIDHPGRRFVVITPIPGSSLYDDCIRDGRITDEAAYLGAIEKSFGIGTVHVNFTPWPDEEIYPRKAAAEQAMRDNYINNSFIRRTHHQLRQLKKRVFGKKRKKSE